MCTDTEIPLAYLITFRSYGTWLHGDERGSTNRFVNQYGTPHIRTNPDWMATNRSRMVRDPVILDAQRLGYVEEAIRDTCDRRRWRLDAVNVRTNHVHVVVASGTREPSSALNALKANATRAMREAGAWTSDKTPWADRGQHTLDLESAKSRMCGRLCPELSG